jgi:hypothetical protein
VVPKLSGTHQLLLCVAVVNSLGENMDTLKRNMETLFDHNKQVGIDINAEETRYELLSRHQSAGQNYNI